jgi:ArsR family transcriptional regulator
MKDFSRVMKALSDPNRVRVLKLLEGGALCVCEIQDVLGLAQPTVSLLMKTLEDAGLVHKERQGTWMFYSLAEDSPSPYAKTMLALVKGWLNEDEEVRNLLAALPEACCRRVKVRN